MSMFFPFMWDMDDGVFDMPRFQFANVFENSDTRKPSARPMQQRQQGMSQPCPHAQSQQPRVVRKKIPLEPEAVPAVKPEKPEKPTAKVDSVPAVQPKVVEKEVMVPKADVVETDTHFIIAMDMPGLKKEAILVSLEDGILTVHAERPAPLANAKAVLRREIPTGVVERQFEVPEGTKPSAIYAKVEDGVLTLRIKKPVAEPTSTIQIA